MKKRFEKLKTSILYVEDEEVVRSTIYEMLRRRVEHVILASDGLEGLELYRSSKPDLVISDIKMPRMDGLDMVREIKQEDADLPIIITSAHSESDYLLRAIDLGINHFVMKPVDNRQLFKIINKIYQQISSQQRIAEEEAQRMVAQRNLRETQEQLRAIFDNVVVGMGIVDIDQSFIFANQHLSEMFYETESSLLRHNLREYLSPDSETIQQLEKIESSQEAISALNIRSEEKVVIPGKGEFWAEISLSTILTEKKQVSKFVIVINDVDNRIKTQKERDFLYNSLISELETAASVQSFFLPDWLSIEDHLLLTNNYTPSTNVGGDLFDIIRLPKDKYLVYIGDISGHGVQSALIMTAVKSTIKMLVENTSGEIEPYVIVNQLNQLLTRDVFRNNYLTLLLGVINVHNQEFTFYNAGHPPIIRFNKSNREVEIIESSGAIPVGWISDYEYTKDEEDVILLDKQSSYLFYTDGIFECDNNQGEELGIEGIERLLRQIPQSSSTLMLPYQLKKQILDNNFDIASDDFTILSLNLRRDINDKIRYYKVDTQHDNTGDVGKHCEEFLKAQNIDCLAFQTELLVNEFLNMIIENRLEKTSNHIIVLRLRILENKLEITFWENGNDWELPEPELDELFLTEPEQQNSCMFIIRSLSSEIVRKRLAEVNETIFSLKFVRNENDKERSL